MLKQEKGFSLIELMIVVAIIGILSAIAVPNFQRFAAKAKQAESKGNLSAYYQAAQATFAEYGYYTGDFVSIGFRPEGTLNYRIAAANGTAPPTGMPNMDTCIDTSVNCAAGFGTANTWTEATATSTSGPATPSQAAAVSDNTFSTVTGGRIGSTTIDTWAISNTKTLTNPQSGLP